MSSKGRGRSALQDDAYETPPWAAGRFLERALAERRLPLQGLWLEPFAGTGNLIRTTQLYAPKLTWAAVEKRDACLPALQGLGFEKYSCIGDFFTIRPEASVPVSVIFSNPPYTHAMQAVEHGLRFAPNVIYLLRQGFLDSDKRNEFLRVHVPDVYLLPNRPRFATFPVYRYKCQSCHKRYERPQQSKVIYCDIDGEPCLPSGTGKTSGDSSTYAWMWFRREPRTEGRLVMLDSTPEAERKLSADHWLEEMRRRLRPRARRSHGDQQQVLGG